MKKQAAQSGFTLIELLVVMFIIGLLVALVAPNIMGRTEKAKADAARAQIANLETALEMFKLDVGRFPTSQEGLDALRAASSGTERWSGPYLKKAVPADPWGKPYVYRSPGQSNAPYELESYGADGVPGGTGDNADIKNWEG